MNIAVLMLLLSFSAMLTALIPMRQLHHSDKVNLSSQGLGRWTNLQLKREIQLRNLALGENAGGRSDEMVAALRKEGIELESNTKPFTLSNQKMTDKTYWTELLIKILAAERRVDSQEDDARAVQNDD